MKIAIISTSHRTNSASDQVSKLIPTLTQGNGCQYDQLLLSEVQLPFWDEEKWEEESKWDEIWAPHSETLSNCDAFIVVVPEWSGMATPMAKNFFLLCDNGELAHKPGLIISVSAGRGGAYPVAELRMSSYKNTKLVWIPDHVILRNVEDLMESDERDYIIDRIKFSISTLSHYATAMKEMRTKLPTDERFEYGM
jgi:NAD(P)H-dependent FMN reductase